MSGSLSGLSLRDLEYVGAVARHGHFGRAAEACGVSQPALSGQVRKLERYLGFALFERRAAGTRLTENGAEFARRAADLVTAARDLLSLASLSREVDVNAGPFRLGVIPTLGPYLFPHAIGPVRAALPALRLLFTEARTADLSRLLREGELDAALVCTPPSDPALERFDLFIEPLLLMHAPDMPSDWPPAPGLLLTLDDGHCLRDQVLAACGLSPSPGGRHATGLELLHHMVAAGEGVSLIPALAAHRLRDAGGLVAFSAPGGEAVARDVMLVARRSHPKRGLIGRLAGVFRGLELPLG